MATSTNPQATQPESSTTATGETPAVSNIRVDPTPENPYGYPPFDVRLIPSYTNKQLRHYQITGATLNADKNEFKNQMKERKTALELVNWDGNTPENTPSRSPSPPPMHSSRILSYKYDSETDSDYPAVPAGHKGIKINPSDITQLRYNSNIAQFNNWLADLRSAFRGDPAKYPTSDQRIILASMTTDEQLKTTFNSTIQVQPAIGTHWRKYKRWMKDVVLHGD
jgi:hypothetical protein